MRKIFFAVVVSLCLACPAWAKIKVIEPKNTQESAFAADVQEALKIFSACTNPHVRRLYEAIEHSDKTVYIGPITSDPATLHPSGSPNRWNTKNRGSQGAAIYVPPAQIAGRGKKIDVFVHEFTHAYDIITFGRGNKAMPVRERRAVFLQNIYRDMTGKKLRNNYHGKFDVEDYQKAKAAGNISSVADYIFTHDDLPK